MWCTHRSKHNEIQVVQVNAVFNGLNVGHQNMDILGGGVKSFLLNSWALPLIPVIPFTLMLLILFRMTTSSTKNHMFLLEQRGDGCREVGSFPDLACSTADWSGLSTGDKMALLLRVDSAALPRGAQWQQWQIGRPDVHGIEAVVFHT